MIAERALRSYQRASCRATTSGTSRRGGAPSWTRIRGPVVDRRTSGDGFRGTTLEALMGSDEASVAY